MFKPAQGSSSHAEGRRLSGSDDLDGLGTYTGRMAGSV